MKSTIVVPLARTYLLGHERSLIQMCMSRAAVSPIARIDMRLDGEAASDDAGKIFLCARATITSCNFLLLLFPVVIPAIA